MFRYLHLIIFKCEWYWSQICQLRSELSLNSRKRHHLRSLCKKALHYIAVLKDLSDGTFELKSNHSLEFMAYAELLDGIVQNELGDFGKALLSLEKAKLTVEELIKRDFIDFEVLQSRKVEIETVIRVCQYSADMQDIKVDNACEIASFQVKQLSIDSSKEEEERGSEKPIFITFGSETVQTKSMNGTKNCLSNLTFGSAEYNAARIQMVYIENQSFNSKFCRLFNKTLRNCSNKSILSINKILSALSRSKAYNLHENYSKYLDWIATILVNVKIIYEAKLNSTQIDLQENITAIFSVFAMIKESLDEIDLYEFKMAHSCLKQESRLKAFLESLSKSLILKKKKVIHLQEAVPVAPKPSFYDMALDLISFSPNETAPENPNAPSGFSNLISSIWKK